MKTIVTFCTVSTNPNYYYVFHFYHSAFFTGNANTHTLRCIFPSRLSHTLSVILIL